MTREAGKGDAPRKDADQEAYASGWDRIFKKNKCVCTKRCISEITPTCAQKLTVNTTDIVAVIQRRKILNYHDN